MAVERTVERTVIIKTPEECFYEATDRNEREEFLEELIETDGMTIENEIRKKFWERRYTPVGKEPSNIDHFMRAWVTLSYIHYSGKGVREQNCRETLNRSCTTGDMIW